MWNGAVGSDWRLGDMATRSKKARAAQRRPQSMLSDPPPCSKLRLPVPALALALALSFGCNLPPETRSQWVSQRMLRSSPVRTPPAGEAWVEAGLQLDPGDSLELPVSWVYGATANTELFTTVPVLRTVDTNAGSESGVGDFVLGMIHRFTDVRPGQHGSALRMATKVPTAENASGLGTGELDFLLAGIFSRECGFAYLTGYYELGILGEPDASTAIQHIWAMSAARAWNDRMGTVAELVWTDSDRRSEEPASLTLGTTWELVPGTILDVGWVLPLNDDAGDPRLLVGATFRP